MARNRFQEIRREQRKSFYLREISQLTSRLSQDEPDFVQLCLTRVELSPDGHRCTVFGTVFADVDEKTRQAIFNTILGKLILYTPSIRTALAHAMSARGVPEIRFAYDAVRERQARVDSILASIEIPESTEI